MAVQFIFAFMALSSNDGEQVKLTIIAEGLPPDVNSKIFVNQTWTGVLLNGSKPAILHFKRGTKISIDVEDRVAGHFGTIYLERELVFHGMSTEAKQIVLNSDVTLLARYEWSHMLLQPMLWPLYCLIAAVLILLLVRRYGTPLRDLEIHETDVKFENCKSSGSL